MLFIHYLYLNGLSFFCFCSYMNRIYEFALYLLLILMESWNVLFIVCLEELNVNVFFIV